LACENCYAERDAKRFAAGKVLWGVGSERREFGDKHWDEPLKWERRAAATGIRERVFCLSMGDVFDNKAPEGARERLWKLIKATPHLDWLLLTKRIGNAKSMLPPDWGTGYLNAWIGISVVTPEEWLRDGPKLMALPAVLRFLSMEPLLSSVTLGALPDWSTGISWVIVGGESGPGARPMNTDWARSLRDECAQASVAFHFKQHGEHLDGKRVGRKAAGRLLDGLEHDAVPVSPAA
jgi:protein gp37